MTDCPACADAAAHESHMFRLGCRGCAARSIARSPQCFDARTATKTDPKYATKREDYKALLGKFGLTHGEVMEAMKADSMMSGR